MARSEQESVSSARLRSLVAGTVVGFVMAIFAVSLANLLFAGSLQQDLAFGLGIVLLSSAIHAFVMSALSGCHGLIAWTQESPAVVLAAGIASIVALSGSQALTTVLVYIALVTLVAGLVLFLLGRYRLAEFIRYMPYPVIGGFLTGTGALLILGGLAVMTGMPVTFDSLPEYFGAGSFVLWLPGLCYGVLMFYAMRRHPHLMTIPLLLATGLVAFYAALFITQTSLQQAVGAGLLADPEGLSAAWSPPELVRNLDNVEWTLIANQAGNIVAVVAITVITVLLNITAIEVALREDLDVNNELRTAGLSNLSSGLLGGTIGFHSTSMTMLSFKMDERARTVGVVAGVVPLLVFLTGGSALAYVPVPLMGAFLVFLGLNFAYQWVFDNRASLSPSDYLAVLAIAVVIVVAGFLAGIIFGLVVIVAIFLVNYSRIDIFHHALSGEHVGSKVQRNPYHTRELARLRRQIYILELRGFIFFGTANKVLKALDEQLATETKSLRYLVLDFRRVTRVDSSAAFSIAKALLKAEVHDFDIVLASLSPDVERDLCTAEIRSSQRVHFFPDLDRSLEWAEDRLIAADELTSSFVPASLEEQLVRRGVDEAIAARLRGFLEPVLFAEDDILMTQGDVADDVYFIEHGRVSVWLNHDGRPAVRLQRLTSGTLVGEIGFVQRGERTATVKADTDTVAYRLHRTDIDRMRVQAPEVALALHELFLLMATERVVSSTNEIAALTR